MKAIICWKFGLPVGKPAQVSQSPGSQMQNPSNLIPGIMMKLRATGNNMIILSILPDLAICIMQFMQISKRMQYFTSMTTEWSYIITLTIHWSSLGGAESRNMTRQTAAGWQSVHCSQSGMMHCKRVRWTVSTWLASSCYWLQNAVKICIEVGTRRFHGTPTGGCKRNAEMDAHFL